MDRRHMLKSAASSAVAAGVLTAVAADACRAQPAALRESLQSGDFVAAADGTRLAYTDWGAGQPVVFIHAWALPSPMWDYQRGPLSEQACVALPTTAGGTGIRACRAADMTATPWPTICPRC
jgi:hypothetical protein